MRKSHIRRD